MKDFSSQITFLNFRNYEEGKRFVSEVLALKNINDIGWAAVYQISDKAFLGVVDHNEREDLGDKDGVLISLVTNDVEAWYEQVSKHIEVTPIKEIPSAGLKSFFFTGPEGFKFEIQQFIKDDLIELFKQK